jgi:hypothetical protein
MAEEDYYFKYNDRPLVLLYLNGFTPSVDEIEHKNTCFELRRVRPGHTDVWSYIEPYPQSLRKGWMPVSPGWDSYMETSWWYEKKNPNPDYEKVKRESSKADRENGEYYKRQLKRAMDAKTDILFISSWNDWQYMNQIEPAKEYGCQYVDLTAEVLGRKEETGYYRR